MPDVITAVTSAVSLTSQLISLSSKIENAEVKNLVADLHIELATVKVSLADLINENRQLKAENKRLHSSGTEVVFKDGAYFKPNNDGPFCTCCYDSSGKWIRLTEMTKEFKVFGKWKCPACDNTCGK